jgi:hypothetical protein
MRQLMSQSAEPLCPKLSETELRIPFPNPPKTLPGLFLKIIVFDFQKRIENWLFCGKFTIA